MTNRIQLLLVLVVGALAALVVAEEHAAEQLSKDVADEGRGRKRLYKFLFKALTPMLSTLSTVLLVKAKIVLVGLFLVGIYFFGHKIWPGGFCGHSIVSEVSPYLSDGITGYHATGPDFVSSYPGPEQWIGGGPGSSYLPPPSNAYLPPTGSAGPPPSVVAAASGTRRGKRAAAPESADEELADNEMYWTDQLTDMGFRFLGVTSRVCRKRFVCEFDFRARHNPLMMLATSAIGRDLFHNYRDADDEQARDYRDCGRIYAECSVQKRTPPRRRIPYRRPTTSTTSTEQPDDPGLSSAEMQDEAINEVGNGVDLGEDVNTERSFSDYSRNDWRPVIASSEPLGRLILRRKADRQ